MVTNRDIDKERKLQRSKTGRATTGTGKVNLNSAEVEDIMEVAPQIGRERAESIIKYREILPGGKFENVRQVGDIPGFGIKLMRMFELFATVDEAEAAPTKAEEQTS